MSNRYLIHLPTGQHLVPTSKQERFFEKLSQSDQYMWSDQKVDVSVAEAKKILEAEQAALIKEREELDQERALFEQERALSQKLPEGGPLTQEELQTVIPAFEEIKPRQTRVKRKSK